MVESQCVCKEGRLKAGMSQFKPIPDGEPFNLENIRRHVRANDVHPASVWWRGAVQWFLDEWRDRDRLKG